MTETPQERARRFMDELDLQKGKHFTVGDVKLMLNNIAHMPGQGPLGASRAPVAVERIQRGDVFIATLVGGKVRPWIVLHVSGQTVSAVAMTSSDESAPLTFPSRCRFWPGSYIAGTVSNFRLEQACEEVTRPYTARTHLTEIEREIVRGLFGGKRRKKAPALRIIRDERNTA
jgi:hypothetical protein